jgi:hypothetical protein
MLQIMLSLYSAMEKYERERKNSDHVKIFLMK